MSIAKPTLYKGGNAHEHYTLLTSVNSRLLSAKLLADSVQDWNWLDLISHSCAPRSLSHHNTITMAIFIFFMPPTQNLRRFPVVCPFRISYNKTIMISPARISASIPYPAGRNRAPGSLYGKRGKAIERTQRLCSSQR